MATKKIKLTAFEQRIEKEIERGEWKPVSAAKKAELLAKLRLAHENLKKGRGGARPGAGRKPLGHVQMTLQLKPRTRSRLVKAAGGSRGVGAVVDRLVEQAFGKNRM